MQYKDSNIKAQTTHLSSNLHLCVWCKNFSAKLPEFLFLEMSNFDAFERHDAAELQELLTSDPKLLETIMDNCITFTAKSDEESVVTFNFNNFVPSTNETKDPESAVMAYISRNHKLQHLLQHPLMAAYETMKWHELRGFRMFNFCTYLAFAFYVTVRICYDYSFYGDWLSLTVTVVGLVPTILSLCVNFTSVENWMGLFASVKLITLFCLEDRNLSLLFLVVVLIGVKVFMMFGTFYTFAVYVDMFKIVVANFCKFMLFYFALLVALTLCFHISVMKRQEGAKSDFMVFVKPFNLLIANAQDEDFDNASVTGIMVHLFFIFMLPVVMSNLLIGLAVSDITDIRSRAEMAFCCGRIQYIHAVEALYKDFYVLRFLIRSLCGRPAIFNRVKKTEAIVVKDIAQDYSFCITSFMRYYGTKLQREALWGWLKWGKPRTLGKRSTIQALDCLCDKKFAQEGIQRDFIITDCYFI